MAELIPSNDATGALDAGIDTDDTALTLESGQGAAFGTVTTSDYLRLRIEDATDNTIYEIVGVSGGRSTDTFSGLDRGLEGTTPGNWVAGDKVAAVITQASLQTWTTQVVNNVSELDASNGRSAVLFAADGEFMQLFYDNVNSAWYSAPWDYNEYFTQIIQGYYSTTFQGNDASLTNFLEGTAGVLGINDNTNHDGIYVNSMGAYNPFLGYTPKPFEIKKWLRTGLELEGRVYRGNIENTNATTDTPHLGPGIYSYDVPQFAIETEEIDWKNELIDESIFGITEPLESIASGNSHFIHKWGNWLTFPVARGLIRPIRTWSDNSSGNATSYNFTVRASKNNQTIILAVFNYRIDGTSAATPTITNSSITFTEIASNGFDTSGSMRGRLTLFRGQASSDGYEDELTVDFAGATQAGCGFSCNILYGEDRSGSNGSAAVIQSASGTSSAGADVSASLSAFANANNATFAAIAMTREAGAPSVGGALFDFSEWDDVLSYMGDNDTYDWVMAVLYKHSTDTTPTADLSLHDSAGMIAIEIGYEPDDANEPDVGDYARPGIVAENDSGGGQYNAEIWGVQYRYVHEP